MPCNHRNSRRSGGCVWIFCDSGLWSHGHQQLPRLLRLHPWLQGHRNRACRSLSKYLLTSAQNCSTIKRCLYCTPCCLDLMPGLVCDSFPRSFVREPYRTFSSSVRKYGSPSSDSGDGRDSARINARSPDNSTGLVPMGSASLGLRQSLEQGNCATHASKAVGEWVWRRRSAPPVARLRMLPCALLRDQPGNAESAISLRRSTGHASGDYVERRGDASKAYLLVR
jgi:hypothetical protein